MQFYEIEIIKIIILLSNHDFRHRMYIPKHRPAIYIQKGYAFFEAYPLVLLI